MVLAGQGCPLFRSSGGESSLASAAFWCLPAFLVPQPHHCTLGLHGHSSSLSSVCITCLCFSSTEIFFMTFMAHPDNAASSHLKIFNLIESVKLIIKYNNHRSQLLEHNLIGAPCSPLYFPWSTPFVQYLKLLFMLPISSISVFVTPPHCSQNCAQMQHSHCSEMVLFFNSGAITPFFCLEFLLHHQGKKLQFILIASKAPLDCDVLPVDLDGPSSCVPCLLFQGKHTFYGSSFLSIALPSV